MMKQDVLIQIIGWQTVEGERDITNLTALGSLEKKGQGYVLEYLESDPGGLENTHMTMTVESAKKVTLTRKGEFQTQMVLEKGIRNICHYNTPYGGLVFGIFAETVHSDLSENGGEVRLHYTIDINNDLASTNEVSIKIRKAGNGHVHHC